jgi:hypothetical protein
MRRWTPRALPALILCITLPAAAGAQPTPAPVTPPAGTIPAPRPDGLAVTPGPVAAPGGTVVVVPNGIVYVDPYHAATPYNPTFVNQAVPNPSLNRPFTTLPCGNPNQNFDPFVPTKPACGQKWFQKKGGCGCDGGACDPTPSQHPILHEATHPTCGACSKGGSCTTCCNTHNFILASSRSYFGESSREFFERPASPDGIKMVPKAYYPVPAPAAYIPAGVIVAKP